MRNKIFCGEFLVLLPLRKNLELKIMVENVVFHEGCSLKFIWENILLKNIIIFFQKS